MNVKKVIDEIISRRVAQMIPPNIPSEANPMPSGQDQTVLLPGSTPGTDKLFKSTPGVPNGKEVADLQTHQVTTSDINSVIQNVLRKSGFNKDSMIPPSQQADIMNDIKQSLMNQYGDIIKVANPDFFR